MKKLIIILFCIIQFSIISAQSLFKPVPSDLFTREATADKTIRGTEAFLWRFSAQLTGVEYQYDKDAKGFISLPLSSVGPAIGYRHYVALVDGAPFNNWGMNLSLLMGMDINGVEPAVMKLALTADLFKLNVGFCYTFGSGNHYGILLGTSIAF